jgi:nucleotide-binding universal stress UspA family protein
MTTTKTLVVPLDGSPFAERALPVAERLGARLQAGVVAITTEWESGFDEPEAYLEHIAARHPAVETMLVRLRDPIRAIEYALLDGPDRTVCMTSHGRGGLRWAMVGSVAEDLIRTAVKPLVVVGRHCDAARVEGKELVVCFDGSPGARSALEVAIAWAKLLGLELQLVFLAHAIDVESLQHPEALFEEALGKLTAEGLRAGTTVLHGTYVPGMLADFAASRDAALIVMSSRARIGVARVALGSTTMGVVGLASSPVLVTHAPK